MKQKTKLGKNLLLFIILGLFFMVGSWFRIKGIIDGSFSFTYDVGRDLLAVKNIVESHDLVLIGATSGLEGLFYGPWWYYFLAIPFTIVSGDPKVIILIFALIGALNIVLAFLVGRSLGGNFLGLVWASFIAVSPTLVSTSSQLWNPNIIPTLVLLAIWSIQKLFVMRAISTWVWIFLGAILFLIIEMEIVFGVFFFVSVSISGFLFLRRKFRYFFLGKSMPLFIIGILLIEMPRIVFEMRHNFLMTRKLLARGFELSTQTQSTNIFSKARIIEVQLVFEKIWTDTLGGGDHLVGALSFLLVVLSCAVLYSKSSEYQKLLLKIIFITSFIFFFGLLFFSQGVWDHYLVGLPILFTLFASLAVVLIFNNFSYPKIAIIVISSIIIINIWSSGILNRFNSQIWEGDPSVYRNQLAIIDYVYKEANGQGFKYILYTPPVHDYTYRYLFSWYGKTKYGYTPDDNEKDLFFFIIEPDNLYPHRLLDWLTYRKFDGKIIKEENVSSGVLVQTRIREEKE